MFNIFGSKNMGGEREFTTPAKSTDVVDQGRVLGNLRIHENNGEIHFHDDKVGNKVAVPVDVMFDNWQKLSSGQKSKFKHKDVNNGTELRMKIVKNKNSPIDLYAEIRQLKKKDFVGVKSNDFQAFDKFIMGQ